MVTDRHESEDVTLVSSRVMKAKGVRSRCRRQGSVRDIFTGWIPEENKQLCFRPPWLRARSVMGLKVCVSGADGCGLGVDSISGLMRPLDLRAHTRVANQTASQLRINAVVWGRADVKTFVCHLNETYRHRPLGVRHVSETPGRSIIKNHRKKV